MIQPDLEAITADADAAKSTPTAPRRYSRRYMMCRIVIAIGVAFVAGFGWRNLDLGGWQPPRQTINDDAVMIVYNRLAWETQAACHPALFRHIFADIDSTDYLNNVNASLREIKSLGTAACERAVSTDHISFCNFRVESRQGDTVTLVHDSQIGDLGIFRWRETYQFNTSAKEWHQVSQQSVADHTNKDGGRIAEDSPEVLPPCESTASSPSPAPLKKQIITA